MLDLSPTVATLPPATTGPRFDARWDITAYYPPSVWMLAVRVRAVRHRVARGWPLEQRGVVEVHVDDLPALKRHCRLIECKAFPHKAAASEWVLIGRVLP